MSVKYLIYILYYDQSSYQEALKQYGVKSWAKLFYIPTTEYLENYFYFNVDTTEWKDYDFIGTLSWKAHTKTFIPIDFTPSLLLAKNNNIEFIFLKYNTKYDFMFERISKRHYYFNVIWRLLLTSLGYTEDHIFSDDIREFCCNYWIASPSIMKEYKKFLEKVKNAMESNEDVKKYLKLNSNYENLPPTTYVAKTGKRFYMYHPFILERMPCFFVFDRKIQTIALQRLEQNNLIFPVHPNYVKEHLIVHIINGSNIPDRNLLQSTFDYVFIFTKQPEPRADFSVPFLVKNIGGFYEAWSDVVLSLNNHYKTITLSKFLDLETATQKSKVIVEAMGRDESMALASFCKAEEGFDENCFTFSVQALSVLKQTMFHPMYYYEKDYGVTIKKKTIVTLLYRGFDVRWYSEKELIIPPKNF